ncbi:hypothetical protein TELCIR_16839 [Teladorsagia circumcincta]|uniref:DUF3456 domain-containing protein n=1 Tax=Teladorsagia circumcincta TaxID=45464 RepID=A0A2G9TW29_TELCI|nr:hypothetical protein TELCIR_16839 [Teladorsagia circumcincta]
MKGCKAKRGLRRTARHHFAGGDTAWEERNLGKYATSETRFIETMEDVCRKNSLKDTSKFNGLTDLESKCAFLVEEHEEVIEEYYYKHQSSNMTTWLCDSRLKLCCPEGQYGSGCAKCPGLEQSGVACYGHGSCDVGFSCFAIFFSKQPLFFSVLSLLEPL